MRRLIVLLLILFVLLPAYSSAELSEDRAAFYQSRTEEWESALGPYHLWNYYQRAMFCSIYGRLPGDYFSPEHPPRNALPTLPPEDVLTYEEALRIAQDFLCSYDARIAEEYLSQLHIASSYYDFWDDADHSITRTAHVQCWFIQFWELVGSDEYARCTVYVDGASGRICSIDLGLDMRHPEDWENYRVISFP